MEFSILGMLLIFLFGGLLGGYLAKTISKSNRIAIVAALVSGALLVSLIAYGVHSNNKRDEEAREIARENKCNEKKGYDTTGMKYISERFYAVHGFFDKLWLKKKYFNDIMNDCPNYEWIRIVLVQPNDELRTDRFGEPIESAREYSYYISRNSFETFIKYNSLQDVYDDYGNNIKMNTDSPKTSVTLKKNEKHFIITVLP